MELEANKLYTCKYVSSKKYGIIVRLEDDSTHFIHISNICDKYLPDTSGLYEVDQEIKAVCIVGKNDQLQLSIKDCNRGPKPKPKSKPKQYNKRNSQSLDNIIENVQSQLSSKLSDINKRSRRKVKH